jgi:hypothetical protein
MKLTLMPMAAALLALPLAALGAAPASCKAGPPTPESYHWNFPREASRLLDNIQVDAAKVESQSAKIVNWDMNPDISWQLHSDQLELVKHEVDDMGRMVCRLRVIRRVTSPWEKAAIDRAGKDVQLLADNTEDAILFLNRYENNFWTKSYRLYTDNIYHESNRLANTMKEYVEYARTNGQDLRLRRELGLSKASS